MKTQFEKELEILINQHCKENDSDTPDFILARYLSEVLKNFNAAVNEREEWYGRTKRIGVEELDMPVDTLFSDDRQISIDFHENPHVGLRNKETRSDHK